MTTRTESTTGVASAADSPLAAAVPSHELASDAREVTRVGSSLDDVLAFFD